MRRHICGGSDPTWFGEEECRLARKDWRWILAIMLHLGPGLGWGNYTDHVALDGHAAIRIRVGGGVHDGLGVYFRTLRKGLLWSRPTVCVCWAVPDVIGTYELDKDLAVEELGDSWGDDRTTSNLRASLIAQSQVSIVLSADGTWTATTIDPVSSAMYGQPAEPKQSRGLWTVSGRRITFMPLRGNGRRTASPLKYLEFTGVLDGQGLMRVYEDPPEEYSKHMGIPCGGSRSRALAFGSAPTRHHHHLPPPRPRRRSPRLGCRVAGFDGASTGRESVATYAFRPSPHASASARHSDARRAPHRDGGDKPLDSRGSWGCCRSTRDVRRVGIPRHASTSGLRWSATGRST